MDTKVVTPLLGQPAQKMPDGTSTPNPYAATGIGSGPACDLRVRINN